MPKINKVGSISQNQLSCSFKTAVPYWGATPASAKLVDIVFSQRGAMGLFDFLTGKVSPDDCARIVLERLRASGQFENLTYDKASFSVAADSFRLSLDNLYRDYSRAKRSEREAVLTRYLSIASTADDEPDADTIKRNLLPVIRGRYNGFATAYMQPAESANIDALGLRSSFATAIPLGVDRDILLVVDTEHSMRFVNQTELDAIGWTFEQGLEQALNNLRDRTVDQWETLAPGLYVGAWQDSYDCSRLLLPDALYRLNLPGRPVALVATRGDLLVTSEHSPDLQRVMLELATQRLEENNRWCGYSLLVLEGNHWVDYAPSAPEVQQAYAQLRNRMLANDYADQAPHLEQDLQAIKRDVFVASLITIQDKETGLLHSLTTWTNEVEAYLPLAERIVLNGYSDDQEAMIVVPWDDAQRLAGHLLKPLPVYPPRFHVTAFPDAALRQQLAAVAVPL